MYARTSMEGPVGLVSVFDGLLQLVDLVHHTPGFLLQFLLLDLAYIRDIPHLYLQMLNHFTAGVVLMRPKK